MYYTSNPFLRTPRGPAPGDVLMSAWRKTGPRDIRFRGLLYSTKNSKGMAHVRRSRTDIEAVFLCGDDPCGIKINRLEVQLRYVSGKVVAVVNEIPWTGRCTDNDYVRFDDVDISDLSFLGDIGPHRYRNLPRG